MPRAKNQKGVDGRHAAAILTPDAILRLRHEAQQARGTSQLDYQQQLLPEIINELEFAYYQTLMGPAFAERYRKIAHMPQDREALLARVSAPRFDWEQLSDPLRGRTFATPSDFRAFLLQYLENDIAEAHQGNLGSALKTACDVLRDIRDTIRLAVDFGGLTPESHAQFCREFTPINNRLAVGPPAYRIAQMIALAEAGILDIFLGPAPCLTANEQRGCFEVAPTAFPGPMRTIDVLVESIIPNPDLRTDQSELIRNLRAKGMLRPFVNRSAAHAFVPGGVDVNERYQLIGADGKPHPDIAAMGVLTEGALLYTTVAARPKVNSRALRDAGVQALRLQAELGGAA